MSKESGDSMPLLKFRVAYLYLGVSVLLLGIPKSSSSPMQSLFVSLRDGVQGG